MPCKFPTQHHNSAAIQPILALTPACRSPEASWHADYRDTAFLYIGGLPFDLSEGDIITIFSQYGEPVFINLVRDKETGKSKGFCFLKYEDQRSTDLAVDNLGGAELFGRTIRVDHTRYKAKDGEEVENNIDFDRGDEEPARKKRKSETPTPARPLLKEEIELQKLLQDHDDEDPMKAYLIEEKKAEVEEALKGLATRPKREHRDKDGDRKSRHHKSHRHRHRSKDGSEPTERKSERRRSRSRSPRRRSHRERSGSHEGGRRRHEDDCRAVERHRRDRSKSNDDRRAKRRD